MRRPGVSTTIAGNRAAVLVSGYTIERLELCLGTGSQPSHFG
jgi:hypothetical protein